MKKAVYLCTFGLIYLFSTAQIRALPALLSDDQELSLPATGPGIKFERIRHLTLRDGVGENILSSPVKFPKAIGFGLFSEEKNAFYIQALVEHYPSVMSLGIKQRKPLTSDDLNNIGKLSKLERLSIDCPISDGITPDFSKLTKLKRLALGPQSSLSNIHYIHPLELPTLTALDIRGTKISENFLQSFNAPCLRRVFLGNDMPETGALGALRNSPKLRILELYNTPIKDTGLSRQLQHVKIEQNSN